jgi:hypothetical protein
MSKRWKNPVANSYVCSQFPNKVVYLKSVHAWKVAAKRIKDDGIQLWMYRCHNHWHLTSVDQGGSIKIDTKAAVKIDEAEKNEEAATQETLPQ